MTRQWQTPPYDMHLQIYFFNVSHFITGNGKSSD